MNLSLIVAVIMIAVIVPWLFRKLFFGARQNMASVDAPWLQEENEADNKAEEEAMKNRAEFYSAQTAETTANQSLKNNPAASSASLVSVSQVLSNRSYHAGSPGACQAKIKQQDLFSASRFRVVRVLAPKNCYFVGYDLLQALQNAGLKYGERQIFHYYTEDDIQDKKQPQKALFSVASAVEPGSFNLQEIGSCAVPGLSLFLDTMNIVDPEKAWQQMYLTAQQLADDLGGKVMAL